MLRSRLNLLATTALVAVGVVAIGAGSAQAAGPYTLSGNADWDSTAGNGMDATAASGDAVNIATHTLTITADGTADQFTVGAITGTSGSVAFKTTATKTALTTTVDSIALSGAGNVTADIANADDLAATITITNGLSTGGALTLTNAEATNNKDLAMSVGGNLAVTGAVTLTAAAGAGGGANTTLTLGGVTNSAGSFSLNDDTGKATLVISSTAAQSVAGTIDGAADGEGTLNINNSHANGATFTGVIGGTKTLAGIGIGTTGNANSTAIFTKNVGVVTTGNIALGDGANTNTVTAIFDTATNGSNITVTGLVVGDGAGNDTAVVTVRDSTSTSLDTVTFSQNFGAANAVDTLNVGDATNGYGGSVVFSGTTKISTININASNTSNALGSAATFTGDLSGSSVITLTGGDHANEAASAIFKGNVTATSITLDDGSVGTTTVTFNANGNTIQVDGTINGGSTGEGAVVVAGSAVGGNAVTFTDAIGGKNQVKSITVGNGSAGGLAVFGTGAGDTVSAGTITVSGSSANSKATFAYATTAGSGGVNVTAGTGTAAAVFSDTLTSTGTITVTAATGQTATATFAKDVSGAITLDDAADGSAASIVFSNGTATLVSNGISAAALNEGTVQVLNSTGTGVTFTGAIGSTSASVKQLTVGDATAAGKGVFNGAVYAKTISVSAQSGTTTADFNSSITAGSGNMTITDGNAANSATATIAGDVSGSIVLNAQNAGGTASVTFDGTSTQTIGAIDVTSSTGATDITFSNSVNLGGNIGTTAAADTVTLAAGKTLTTTAARTIKAAAFNNSGTLSLANTLTLSGAGTFDLGANAASKIVMSSPSTSYSGGTLISANTGGSTVNATNAISLVPHSTFNSGSLTLVDTDGGTGNIDAVNKWNVTSNALTTYTVSVNGAGDVILTATEKSAGTIAANLGTTADAVTALSAGVQATKGDTAVANAYNTALLAGGSEAKKAAEQSQPNVTASAAQAITSAARGSAGAVSARLASARTGVQVAGLQETGVAAGDGSKRNGGWGKAFGNIAEQSERDGFAGYDSHTYGVAVGMDNKVTETVRVGAAVSYAQSNIDSKDTSKAETDINSYQVAVYGSYEPGKYYVEGQLAYAYNQVDTTRQINFGGLNRVASGNYDANQYTATLGAGVPLKQNAVTITPKAGLFYSYTDPQSYTETGAGAMNLEVNPDSTSILEGSLGVNVAYDHKVSGGMLRPEARAAVLYEFLGDKGAATSKFSGAGASFRTEGLEPAQFGGTVGVGLGYTTANGQYEFRGDYDAELRDGFVGHTGMLTGRINF